IVELLADDPTKKVVLNCNGVNRMDSSGVGLFIFLRSRYKEKIVFRICELPERILELFRMTQLESFFDMDASEADSIKALRG
ncbi:MAG: STAS domain-containing protein, partial [Spirochaetia bacterium]|nr:STAS domain-containing protein [Spirochaetia bacterium]